MNRELRNIPIIGVSLGRRFETTGISVAERTYLPTGEQFTATHYDHARRRTVFEAREKVRLEYHVRHLERQGPPTIYTRVAKRVSEIARKVSERGRVPVAVIVDVTAAGMPAFVKIHQALKDADIDFKYRPVEVGEATGVPKNAASSRRVPRRDLISVSQILFDDGVLKIAEGLSLSSTLRDELVSFKPKAPTTKADDPDAWREAPNDDLVLSLAVGLWASERFMRKEESRPAGDEFTRVTA